MNTLVIISAVVKDESEVGLHKCVKCGESFSRKEVHLQDVLAISNPGRIDTAIGSKFYGLPISLHNIFIKNHCPFCKWHNQNENNLIVINCELNFQKERVQKCE